MTIIPELAIQNMVQKTMAKAYSIVPPAPVGEVSITYHKYSNKIRFIDLLEDCIKRNIPVQMLDRMDSKAVEIGKM